MRENLSHELFKIIGTYDEHCSKDGPYSSFLKDNLVVDERLISKNGLRHVTTYFFKV